MQHTRGIDIYHAYSSSSDATNVFQGSRPFCPRQAACKEPPQSKPRSDTKVVDKLNDTQTGMLLGIPRSARCVQRFDDSLNSAIHITYRISLRSSSMREPRDPLLKVVYFLNIIQHILNIFKRLCDKDIDLERHKEKPAFSPKKKSNSSPDSNMSSWRSLPGSTKCAQLEK
jgi:hypothetical protein